MKKIKPMTPRTKVFIGGMITATIAITIADTITQIIINIIK